MPPLRFPIRTLRGRLYLALALFFAVIAGALASFKAVVDHETAAAEEVARETRRVTESMREALELHRGHARMVLERERAGAVPPAEARTLAAAAAAKNAAIERETAERREALARSIAGTERRRTRAWALGFLGPLLDAVRALNAQSAGLVWNLEAQTAFWKGLADAETLRAAGDAEGARAAARAYGEEFEARSTSFQEQEESPAQRQILEGAIRANRLFRERFRLAAQGTAPAHETAALFGGAAEEAAAALAAHEAIERHDLEATSRVLGQLNDAIRATLNGALGVTGLALLLGGGLALRSTRTLRGRLGAFRAGIGRLASGDLDARLEEPPDDDLGALARALNTMAADLRALQGRLVHSEKLASVGVLTGGIAHEFNNLLGSISIEVESSLAHPDPESVRESLEAIRQAVDTAAVVLRNLLNFSKRLEPRREALRVGPVVDSALQLVRRDLGNRGIRVEARVPQDLRAQADPVQLQLVLVNLFTNARDAMPKGGELRIEGTRGGGMARLSVSDTGGGIAPRDREGLFEPFHTTKGNHGAGEVPGTGLGLYVSREIARSHGGELVVDETGSRGTRMIVTIPEPEGSAG